MKTTTLQEAQTSAVDANDLDLPSIKKIISVYIRTTGSCVHLYDRYMKLLPELFDNKNTVSTICRNCPEYLSNHECQRAITLDSEPLLSCEPCHDLHINAIRESCNSGGTEIYSCRMGLAFWSSPMFIKGSYAGSLRGSGYLQSDALPNTGSVSLEFVQLLEKLKSVDREKIKSMAEMLLLCAATLSPGSNAYHDILRRKADQQQNINSRLIKLKADSNNETSPGYPIEHERRLMEALRHGDSASAASSLNDLLAVLLFYNQDNFKYIQLRALELAAMLSRTDKDASYGDGTAANYPFIIMIKNSKSFEDLADALHSLVNKIALTIAPFRCVPHAAAMRRAEKFIQENFTRKIGLSEIASFAGLSPPYFSTIFRKEMGENFSTYLNRLRVNKAKHMLLETKLPLSAISIECCFEDQSWFSRTFKSFTGISPGKFRQQGGVFTKSWH